MHWLERRTDTVKRRGQNKQSGVTYRLSPSTSELFRPLALVLIGLQLLTDITFLAEPLQA